MRQLKLKFRVTSGKCGVNHAPGFAPYPKRPLQRGEEGEVLEELEDAGADPRAVGVLAAEDLGSAAGGVEDVADACSPPGEEVDGLRPECVGEDNVALPAAVPAPDVEQHEGGVAGLGADTPAMSDPRPIFCSVGASSLPLGSNPCCVWNFCKAATVFESSLPEGSP